MTRWAVATLAAAFIACVLLGALYLRTRDQLAEALVATGAEVEAYRADLADAQGLARELAAEVEAAEAMARAATERATAARAVAPARIARVRAREAEIVREAPSEDGARASLEREAEARAQVGRLRLQLLGEGHPPLGAALGVPTSTAALAWVAMARWEGDAWAALELASVSTAALDAAEVRARAAVARANLATARGAEQAAALRLGLAEAHHVAAGRVSRASRAWAVAGAAACAAGAVGALAGLSLCRSGECRQALGVGGAVVGGAGCAALALAW